MNARPEVLVAMSGGVDSSVAAALLLEQGFAVTGVTMKLWGGDSDSGCCSVSDVDDARRVADQLGIDHHVFNFGDDFDERVVQPYVAAYASGITPNPCIECNRHLKFDRLLRRADALGFDDGGDWASRPHRVGRRRAHDAWRRGADPLKDQSYVLYMLRQPELARIVLPIGDIDKAAVRAIAARLGLRTATKPDSQDVCFITAVGGREAFLGDRIPLRAGPYRRCRRQRTRSCRPRSNWSRSANARGSISRGTARRRFVVDVDVASATVVVGSREDLDRDRLDVGRRRLVGRRRRRAVPRAVQRPWRSPPATIDVVDGDHVTVHWDEPQRRVAPGQSAVFYDGDTVLGGGIVQR